VIELAPDQVAALVAARGRAGLSGLYPESPSPNDQRRNE
jgi:hypothetical protein